MGGACRTHEVRNEYKILVRKPEGKRPFRRSRHRLEDTRMQLRKVGWEDVDKVMNFWVP
jgi:hypothetical protein